MISLRSAREIDRMRTAGSALAGAFVEAFDRIKPGSATGEIDRCIENGIVNRNARPAFKGYRGSGGRAFPAATCISIDAEIVHGIPSQRALESGQIVGIDVGLELDGWFADMACSFLIGKTKVLLRKLWRVTREALYLGIDQARDGRYLGDIGAAIEDHVTAAGFSVIRDLVGHGIGTQLHEEPQVPNYRLIQPTVRLRAGMTLAIEPMVAAGNHRIKILKDGWTAVSRDRSPTAHFEHTVLVTDGEPEILTLLDSGEDPLKIAAECAHS